MSTLQFHVYLVGLTHIASYNAQSPLVKGAYTHFFVLIAVYDDSPLPTLSWGIWVGCCPMEDDKVKVGHSVEESIHALDKDGHVNGEDPYVTRAGVGPTAKLGKVGTFYKLLALRKYTV